VSLNAVLIDRGRLISKAATGQSVEGTKQYGEVESEWFRCRLFPDETTPADGARGGRRILTKGPHVVVGLRDVAADLIENGEITTGKLVELNVYELGPMSQRWQIGSDPQPLRRRKKNLGWYFVVQRVETA
jgi:hypothetical protein